jgi:hypothetical protein
MNMLLNAHAQLHVRMGISLFHIHYACLNIKNLKIYIHAYVCSKYSKRRRSKPKTLF